MIIFPLKLILLLPLTLSLASSSVFNTEGIWESQYNEEDSPQIVSISIQDTFVTAGSKRVCSESSTAPSTESTLTSGSDTHSAFKRYRRIKSHKLSFLDLSLSLIPERAIAAEFDFEVQGREKDLRNLFSSFFNGNPSELLDPAAFLAAFNAKPGEYSVHGVPQYVSIWAFALGAQKFFPELRLERDFHNSAMVVDMFKYLFTHTPFERATYTVFLISNINLTQTESTEIREFIDQKYSGMSTFHQILLNLMLEGLKCNQITDYHKFPDMTRLHSIFVDFYRFSFAGGKFSRALYDLINRIPFDYPEFYASTSLDFKFIHSTFSISNDDLKAFIKILLNAPTIVTFNRDPSRHPQLSIFTVAVKIGAKKCFEFLINAFPEILTDNLHPDLNVLWVMIKYLDVPLCLSFLETINAHGITLDSKIVENGIEMNLLQASFHFGNKQAFRYFLGIAGKERAISDLNAIWKTKDNIFKHAHKVGLENILSSH